MKVGVITDTHYGGITNHPTATLDNLIDYFKSEDVTTVIHLGDVGEDLSATKEENLDYIKTIFNKLSDFTTYLLRGNHDVLYFSPAELESNVSSLDHCVTGSVELQGGDERMLLVETGSTLNDNPIGYIPDDTIPEIVSYLTDYSENRYIFSHYPLQYTEYYQERPYFNVQPEYAFPVNKPILNYQISEVEDNINTDSVEFVCGHLHPPTQQVIQTEPYGFELTIKEAITGFREEQGELIFYENTSLNFENLVYDL